MLSILRFDRSETLPRVILFGFAGVLAREVGAIIEQANPVYQRSGNLVDCCQCFVRGENWPARPKN